ncbi:hypothetical protein H5410_028293, partial [Solanum commersonii]
INWKDIARIWFDQGKWGRENAPPAKLGLAGKVSGHFFPRELREAKNELVCGRVVSACQVRKVGSQCLLRHGHIKVNGLCTRLRKKSRGRRRVRK